MAMDIEQNGTFGWSSGSRDANQSFLNGFRDFLTSQSPAKSGCPHASDGGFIQPAVYSAPAQWSYSFTSDTLIPNFLKWTYESTGNTSFPGSFTGGKGADWFGSSAYRFAWQYRQGPDWDIAYEPISPPLVGTTLGN